VKLKLLKRLIGKTVPSLNEGDGTRSAVNLQITVKIRTANFWLVGVQSKERLAKSLRGVKKEGLIGRRGLSKVGHR